MKEKRIIMAGTALILVAAIATLYWFISERERHRAVQEVSVETLDVESAVLADRSTGELEVSLFYYRPGAVSAGSGFLEAEKRTIYRTDDSILVARQIVNELLKGRQVDQNPVSGDAEATAAASHRLFPESARLRNLYILQDGTAVVDLTAGTIQGLGGGITSELALILSVTRSLRQNIPEVKMVRFLVEGRSTETLAGHISITEPFR